MVAISVNQTSYVTEYPPTSDAKPTAVVELAGSWE